MLDFNGGRVCYINCSFNIWHESNKIDINHLHKLLPQNDRAKVHVKLLVPDNIVYEKVACVQKHYITMGKSVTCKPVIMDK